MGFMNILSSVGSTVNCYSDYYFSFSSSCVFLGCRGQGFLLISSVDGIVNMRDDPNRCKQLMHSISVKETRDMVSYSLSLICQPDIRGHEAHITIGDDCVQSLTRPN